MNSIISIIFMGMFIIPILIPLIFVIGVIVKFIERQEEKKHEDLDKYDDY